MPETPVEKQACVLKGVKFGRLPLLYMTGLDWLVESQCRQASDGERAFACQGGKVVGLKSLWVCASVVKSAPCSNGPSWHACNCTLLLANIFQASTI